jgi:hypothetical protein
MPLGAADHDAVINDFREFLLENGAVRAEPVVVGRPEPGQRPGEVIDLVMLGATLVGTAADVIGLIRAWLADRRGRNVVSVRLEIDSQEVEIFASPTYDEEKRVDDFVRSQSGE